MNNQIKNVCSILLNQAKSFIPITILMITMSEFWVVFADEALENTILNISATTAQEYANADPVGAHILASPTIQMASVMATIAGASAMGGCCCCCCAMNKKGKNCCDPCCQSCDKCWHCCCPCCDEKCLKKSCMCCKDCCKCCYGCCDKCPECCGCDPHCGCCRKCRACCPCCCSQDYGCHRHRDFHGHGPRGDPEEETKPPV